LVTAEESQKKPSSQGNAMHARKGGWILPKKRFRFKEGTGGMLNSGGKLFAGKDTLGKNQREVRNPLRFMVMETSPSLRKKSQGEVANPERHGMTRPGVASHWKEDKSPKGGGCLKGGKKKAKNQTTGSVVVGGGGQKRGLT